MRIAQVPKNNFQPLPPDKTRAREWICWQLTEGFVAKGHDVTLFAASESKTKAKIEPVIEGYEEKGDGKIVQLYLRLYEIFKNYSGKFDIIHDHAVYESTLFSHFSKCPVVSMVHWYDEQINWPTDFLKRQVPRLKNHFFVPISEGMRQQLLKIIPGEYLTEVIYNGIDLSEFKYNPRIEKTDYIFLGRLYSEKGYWLLPKIARMAKIKIKLAGYIPKDLEKEKEKRVWQKYIDPAIKSRLLEYVGEIDHKDAPEFLNKAKVFINPLQYEEPFGLVMAESLACGTPVVSFARGGAKEIIEDGKNGFLVSNLDDLVKRIKDIDKISSKACVERAKFFSLEKMVENYERLYKKITTAY
jgi:glycosyltransferase involved in cell wall biosynthesis